MKKRMIAIAAATMATMMMTTPVLAEDYKIGICKSFARHDSGRRAGSPAALYSCTE